MHLTDKSALNSEMYLTLYGILHELYVLQCDILLMNYLSVE